MDENTQKLHALLYAQGGEMKKSDICTALNCTPEELEVAQRMLREQLATLGLQIYEVESTLSLRTHENQSEFITRFYKKDTEKDIGSAGLEVLAIVLYKGGASRATIDYIRGVNSSGTLRQLVLRGLLERARHSEDSRAWVYTVTPELLAHLGIQADHELPEFTTLHEALSEHLTQHNERNE